MSSILSHQNNNLFSICLVCIEEVNMQKLNWTRRGCKQIARLFGVGGCGEVGTMDNKEVQLEVSREKGKGECWKSCTDSNYRNPIIPINVNEKRTLIHKYGTCHNARAPPTIKLITKTNSPRGISTSTTINCFPLETFLN